MLKKLILVYNPRSAQYGKVQDEVISVVRKKSGWLVGKYEVKPTSFDDNVRKLAKLLDDDMLVISAGGDGTATMTINAIMNSGKDLTFAALGYGNFNDIAGMLRTEIGEVFERYEKKLTKTLYPLEIAVDGEHWRYAPAYFSAGLLAEATQLMEEPEVRKKLNLGHKNMWFSLRMAVKWYLKNHKRSFMPAGEMNGRALNAKTTDYIAVNGPTLAGVMKGGQWWRDSKSFGSTVQELGKFWRMVKFGLKSVRKGIPLEETKQDVITFAEPSEVEVHIEGEFARLRGVQKIEVHKTEKSLRVIAE